MKPEWLRLQDIVGMDTEEGFISFRGNRLLLFHADSLRQLKDELIRTLGFDLARGVFSRFGYRCGQNDSQSIKTIFEPKAENEWMLAGPKLHTLEGMVHVTNEVLDYDRQSNHFYMRGIWRNSYEAEEYLKIYGRSEQSVCWTLVGYTSGYCSEFFGRETICVETKCVAHGDPYCQYEVRTKEEWDGRADKYRYDLQPNAVVKSLQHMLREERERVGQWRVLNDTALLLSQGLNFDPVDKAVYHKICQLLFAEKAYLAVCEDHGPDCRIFAYELAADSVRQKMVKDKLGVLLNLMVNGSSIHLGGENLPLGMSFLGNFRDLLGVPLVVNGRETGLVFVVNKMTAEGFTYYDENLLTVLGSQMAMAMENTRLYQLTDRKLKDKNQELIRINEYLTEQQKFMQESMSLHDRLTSLVLENAGIHKIVNTMSQAIGLPVWIEDKDLRVMARNKNGATGDSAVGGLLTVSSESELREVLARKQTEVLARVDCYGKKVRLCFTPIIAGKEILGVLVVDLLNKSLAEDVKLILRDASVIIALEILKRKVLVQDKRRLVKNLLDDWLFGESCNEEQVLDRIFKLGLALDYPINQFVLEVSGEEFGQLKRLVNNLEERLPAQGIVGFQDHQVVVLFCQDQDGLVVEQMAGDLEKELSEIPHLQYWLTIAAKSDSIEDTRQNFINACAVNKILKLLQKNNTSFRYEQLGVYGMLGIHPERFVWFTNKLLGEVIEYDRKHNTELIVTLKLFFQNNQNIQATARRGFINNGTLKYRLKRIQEIAKLNLSDSDVSLQVQLALKFL
ncbi:carbohydrate diacid transcriptional activator CdaR [Peptococcaceae bacterium CEB3]|nr:carbohydrate diacid transcriptional activator CdaR [Peptococcaceae bacterium CEB3]